MSNAYIFTGQGSQYVGMGKDLYESIPVCRDLFDQADSILGFDLTRFCFEGPEEELTRTDICQPAILVHSAVILEALRSQSKMHETAATGGLSLGEYSALYWAGVINFENAVKLVRKRGQFMQEAAEATPSGMASVLKLGLEVIEEHIAWIDGVSIANLNCPGQTVISGEKAALAQAVEALSAVKGGRVIPLSVAGAFHSPVMEPARTRLAEELARIDFAAPSIPVASNVNGELHTDPQQLKDNILEQLVAPVKWEACIRTMMAAGVDTFFDIGPNKVLAGLNKRIDRQITTVSFDTVDSLQG